ncbi:hypothetical protein EJB05_55387, partial [Eragrostis curvula]
MVFFKTVVHTLCYHYSIGYINSQFAQVDHPNSLTTLPELMITSMKMPQTKLLLVVAILVISQLLFSPSTAAAAREDEDGKPLVIRVLKDNATSLYTIPIKDDKHPLVLDLSSPLIWSTCHDSHPTFKPHEHECKQAKSYTHPSCSSKPKHAGDSLTAAGLDKRKKKKSPKCVTHPYNPITGKCGDGDLTRTNLSASATNGVFDLYPVSFPAVTSCAPDALLASLPAGAAGVAGLSDSKLSLQAQIASTQKVDKKFALCLSSGSEGGVAIFGGGPLIIPGPGRKPDRIPEATVPLHSRRDSSGGYYYIKAKGITINTKRVPIDDDDDLIVELSLRTPYTSLRSDVYHALKQAFDNATSEYAPWVKHVPPVAPFELCYNSSQIPYSRYGQAQLPPIELRLERDETLTIWAPSSIVSIGDEPVACFAFVEMKEEQVGETHGPAPAIVMGGYQLEQQVLLFDTEEGRFGTSGLMLPSCGNFMWHNGRRDFI